MFSSDLPHVAGEASGSGRSNSILVDVEGAVVHPGVYTLEYDARVDDAIQQAGGYAKNADIQAVARGINRAARLVDGAKLYIPAIGEQVFAQEHTKESGVSRQVNINTASLSELETLSGVGPVTAEKVMTNRPYLTLEELVEKNVISQNLFTKLQPQLSL